MAIAVIEMFGVAIGMLVGVLTVVIVVAPRARAHEPRALKMLPPVQPSDGLTWPRSPRPAWARDVPMPDPPVSRLE